MKGLAGKTVLVTGGGGAIGAAICRRFAEAGAALLVCDKNREAAERVAQEVKGKARVFDISKYQDAKAAVGSEAVDILINNAGWDRFENFLDTKPEEWETLLDINLRGPLNMHHIVVPGMIQRAQKEGKAGRVINISSDAARVGSSGESVYSACKGGIIAFSKTLARELARKGVTVNVVCPGPTDTPILRGFLGEGEAGQKVYDALVRAIPMKRVGQPDDIPGIVAFLASDEAAFITGQVISVSGGLTMAG
jgi:2-hydroxycyclohexanecarboxyl-CoA dehydrogenase